MSFDAVELRLLRRPGRHLNVESDQATFDGIEAGAGRTGVRPTWSSATKQPLSTADVFRRDLTVGLASSG